MLPGILGSMAGLGGGGPTAAYMGLVDEGVSVTFGAASTDRRMVAVIHWGEFGAAHYQLTGATIGGVAATIHIQRGHSGGSTGLGVGIISALVPTGASGIVDCTFDGGVTAVACGVYRLSGLISGTPTDTDSDQSMVTTTDLTVTITVSANGIVIAGFTGSTLSVPGVVWTGVTEQYDGQATVVRSGGFASGLLAQNLVVTADITPKGNSGNDLVVASWA